MRLNGRKAHWLLLGLGMAFMLAAVGCGRLQVRTTVERDLEVDALGGDNIKSVIVSGTTSQQMVKVLVRTDGAPVDVYVVLERDQEALENQLGNQQQVTVQTLAKSEKIREGQIEATVPAGNGFAVVVVNNGTKKASVSLKVSAERK